MELEPFLYYLVFTKTPNLSHVKWKLVYLDQYSPRNYIKGSMGKNIYTLQDGR